MTFKVRESFNRTVAHELGHGAFTWQHPFDEPFKNEQGATRNLMDYVADDDLAYFQWQSTLGLNLTWGFLEGDEDAMFTDKMFLYDPNFRLFTTLNKMNVLGLEYKNSPWKGDKPYFDFCLKCNKNASSKRNTAIKNGLNLNLPDGPNNGGVNWAKPPYSGTGFTQGMGIDMYILDEKPIYFEDGDLIRIYDKDGNLKCTLEFRKSKSDDSGKFLLTEESSEIYLKSILTTK